MLKMLLACLLVITVVGYVLARASAVYALVDLVSAPSAEAAEQILNNIKQRAEAVGGNTVVVSRVLVPIIAPGKKALAADRVSRFLVVTEYPSSAAGEDIYAARTEWLRPGHGIRTFAATPVRGLQALIQHLVPATLGLFNRVEVARENSTDREDALIAAAHLLRGDPETGLYEDDWQELLERSDQGPLWMLNFLSYRENARYAEGVESGKSGRQAYQDYGAGMIGALAAVGGRVGWSGYNIKRLSVHQGETDSHGNLVDGEWDEIVVALYPSTLAMLTMVEMEQYRAVHPHRLAALARTRLLATQPLTEQRMSKTALVNQ